MASIRKRGDRYYIDYRVNGKRVRKSVGTSKEQAEALLKEIQHKKQQGVHSSGVTQITFDELCALFHIQTSQLHSSNTQERYAAILHNFRQFLSTQSPAIKYINSITLSLIDRYKSYRISQGVKNKTINSELMVIRMLLRLAIKLGHLAKNPAEDVTKLKEDPRDLPRYLSIKECGKLLDAADSWSYNVFFTLLNTGLRKYELEHLTWDDIDLDNRQIRVINQDQRQVLEEDRLVPINVDLYELLMTLNNGQDKQDFVFTDPKGQTLSKNFLRNTLIKIAKHCGLDDVTQVNVLRNTFAAQLVLNGIELAAIKELMGASDQYMDLLYSALTKERAVAAVNALNFKPSGNSKREASE